MFEIFIDFMLGSFGRAIKEFYLDNAFVASIILLAWMVVICIGLYSVHSMRYRLHKWVKEMLPHDDPDSTHTPEQLLLALETRWNDAASQVRFMPTKHGLWIQRATSDRLRGPVGFTPAGIELIIARIIGRARLHKSSAVSTTITQKRSAHQRQHKPIRSQRKKHMSRVYR